MIPGANCVDCVFWNLTTLLGRAGVRLGECRAHAPSLHIRSDDTVKAKFPLMGEDEWCGDHSRHEADPADA